MVEFVGGVLDGEFRIVERDVKSHIHIWYVDNIKHHCFYVREGETFKVWRKSCK